MSDTTAPQTDPTRPVPCYDRPRCRRQKAFNITTGTVATGHLIGNARSCAYHLAESVAYAATIAQPVFVTYLGASGAAQAEARIRDHQFNRVVCPDSEDNRHEAADDQPDECAHCGRAGLSAATPQAVTA